MKAFDINQDRGAGNQQKYIIPPQKLGINETVETGYATVDTQATVSSMQDQRTLWTSVSVAISSLRRRMPPKPKGSGGSPSRRDLLSPSSLTLMAVMSSGRVRLRIAFPRMKSRLVYTDRASRSWIRIDMTGWLQRHQEAVTMPLPLVNR